MAVTLVASDGTGGNKTSESQTTITLSPSTALAVDDVVVLLMAADNAATSGGHPFNTGAGWRATLSSGAITWETQLIQNRTAGSVTLDGASLFVVTGKVTATVAANATLLFQFSWTTIAKAWRVLIFRGALPALQGANSSGAGSATPSVGILGGGSVAAGGIVLGAVAVESAAAITAGDTDTTHGSWSSALNASSAGSGGDSTKMSLGVQYKVVGAAGTQEFNPTVTSTDSAICIFWLAELVTADRTATLAATGGGVAVLARSSARSRAQAMTGGGIAVLARAKNAARVVAMTGGGVVTTSYSIGAAEEHHTGTATLTGGGVITRTGVKRAVRAQAMTGGGVAAVLRVAGRRTAAVATGGGRISYAYAAGSSRSAFLAATGGGVITIAATAVSVSRARSYVIVV